MNELSYDEIEKLAVKIKQNLSSFSKNARETFLESRLMEKYF
ncbi:MAG: hypothetical protein N2250_09250 [Pseudothermotoga sp.]|nr:hypothetical protein [Pseudothermotoga sp.]